MRYSFILPDWLKDRKDETGLVNSFEKEERDLSENELSNLNEKGYNVYYYPNHNSKQITGALKGGDIDVFKYIYIDMDLKDGTYESKTHFMTIVDAFPLKPTKTIDSGHGVHIYWQLSNLTQMKYMELQKRLISHFKTDSSIWTLKQLMRVPGYLNTKVKDSQILCKESKNPNRTSGNIYTVEDFDTIIPTITAQDKLDIEKHYNKIILGVQLKPQQIAPIDLDISDKFKELLDRNEKLSNHYYNPKDRSKSDMIIANVLYVSGFSRSEAEEVIATTQKGIERGISYSIDLVKKVYDNPPAMGDDSFEEAQALASKELIVKKEEEEIRDYTRKKTLEKVRQSKEDDKIRGIFSLKNVKTIWLDHYKKSIVALDESMQNRLPCMSEALSEVVPLEGVEMILLAAESGKGKTTTAVNIAVPILELGKKVLYISTEERAEDILIKVAAVKNRWNPNEQRDWSYETRLIRDKHIEEIVNSEQLLVVDNYCPGVDEKTGKPIKAPDLTNLDELKMVLNSVLRDGMKFDLLIVDYISKVGTNSEKDAEWMTIFKATKFLEEWTKAAQTPSVVFTQLKVAETEKQEFQQRLPGSKRILNSVTCAIEIKTDYEAYTSTWICHKNRKYGRLFKKTLKFDKGKFVDYTQDTDN